MCNIGGVHVTFTQTLFKEFVSHMWRHTDMTVVHSPLRSVSGCWYRSRRPPEAVYPQDEFCEGLGARLPPAEHQGDPVLDRDPPPQSSTVTG